MKLQVDEPRPFKLVSPASVEEAVRLWHDRRGEAMYLAGGGDVLDVVKRHLARPVGAHRPQADPRTPGHQRRQPHSPAAKRYRWGRSRRCGKWPRTRVSGATCLRSPRRLHASPRRRSATLAPLGGISFRRTGVPTIEVRGTATATGGCTATPTMASTASTPFSPATAATSCRHRIWRP